MHDRVVTKLFKPSIWNPQTPFAETASSPGLHSFMATFFRCVIPKAEDDASTRLVLTSESFECGIGTLQTIQNESKGLKKSLKDVVTENEFEKRLLVGAIPSVSVIEVDSWSSSRDPRSGYQASSHRTSFSSSASDNDPPVQKIEPAYSFVGMHCIFDQYKASVTVWKFGNKSSDLLAYGAADGTPT